MRGKFLAVECHLQVVFANEHFLIDLVCQQRGKLSPLAKLRKKGLNIQILDSNIPMMSPGYFDLSHLVLNRAQHIFSAIVDKKFCTREPRPCIFWWTSAPQSSCSHHSFMTI